MSSTVEKRKLQFQHTFSQEHCSEWRRRSLIEDAKFDIIMNSEFRLQQKNATAQQNDKSTCEEDVDEEEIIIQTFILRLLEDPNDEGRYKRENSSTSFCATNGLLTLFEELKKIRVNLISMETRKAISTEGMELLLQVEIPKSDIQQVLDFLRANKSIQIIHHKTDNVPVDDPLAGKEPQWFPKHVSDLDKCTHLVLKFQPELATDHPGFHDTAYRQRRSEIAELAFGYRHGQCIPRVDYSEEENNTWKEAYATLKALYPEKAGEEQMRGIKKLETAGLFTSESVPQLEDISNYMKHCSGFRLRPVAGLLSARDFLASLAFRVFQATQYVRHHSKPLHTPEPDCIHELLGHVPMLCDREFAEFSQEIGLVSLGASDEDISRLATLYWFTVEFGLCRQKGRVVAVGAGLLSSYGELNHALSDVPERREFDAHLASVTPYRDEDYQSIYYVAESVQSMKDKLREFSKSIHKPFHVRYDPYTETIEVLNNREYICHLGRVLRQELENMERAMSLLA